MITVSNTGNSIEVVEEFGKSANYPLGSVACILQSGVITMYNAEGRALHTGKTINWSPNTLEDLRALGIFAAPPTAIDTTGLATSALQADQIAELEALNASISSGINVSVSNQVDISNIEATLTSVLSALQNIDTNTDNVETLLSSVITELQDNGILNNTNLLTIVTELQGIDANTSQQETLLNSIVSNTTGIATAANQASVISLLTALKLLAEWRSENSNPFSVTISDAQTGGLLEYGLIAIRIKTGETLRVKVGKLTGFVESSDNYCIHVYEYDREGIDANTIGLVTWSDLGEKCEASVSTTGVPRVITSPGIKKFSFMSRDVNNISEQLNLDITNDTKEYLFVFQPFQIGSDSYMSVNINELL